MKLGKERQRSAKPAINKSKRHVAMIGLIVVTAVLIAWVITLGRKAEETISVVMWAEPVYKNELITESMLKEYPMIKAEFEKYAVTDSNGNKTRRIVLWEERNKLVGTYAAYPLRQETLAEKSDVIISRINNSDTVLYSFPGKNIVKMEAGESDLKAFKTFLQPGDRINISAIYSEETKVYETDEYGNDVQTTVEVFREETPFKDIMIADMLNSSGDSILDIYASYNEKSSYQQAQLDASEAFQDSVIPSSLLVALTPEEEETYYYYLGKNDIEFRISLPQRSE